MIIRSANGARMRTCDTREIELRYYMMSAADQAHFTAASRVKSFFATVGDCRGFCRYLGRRRLSGWAVFLVLTILTLVQFAFFEAVGNTVSYFLSLTKLASSAAKQSLVQSFIVGIITPIMYPFAGWIGCAWLGRYRTAKWCLGMLWFGYSGVALLFCMRDGQPYEKLSPAAVCVVVVSFMLIVVGSAGVQVNLIPFGADLVLYKTSEELSSYFYWNYWGRNLGGLAYFFCEKNAHYFFMSPFLAALSITLALVLCFLCGQWLVDDQERQNSPKLIWSVLYSACSAKRPQARSAFSFTGSEVRPPRLDLAKQKHGGKFHVEEVEDVKTFLRLLLLLFSLSGALALYSSMTSVMKFQLRHMRGLYVLFPQHISNCATSPTSVWVYNIATILVAIPVIDLCLHPCLRQYAPNMLKRFGMGYVLLITSVALLCLFEVVGHNALGSHRHISCLFKDDDDATTMSLSKWLALIPIIILSIGEIFLKVTALEFVYAQSPHSMRAMMVGLFYLVDGISSTLAALVVFGFITAENSNQYTRDTKMSCGFWYYSVFLVLGIVTLALYLLMATRYRNRTRGDLDMYNGPYYRLSADSSNIMN